MSVYTVKGLGGLKPPSVGDWKPPMVEVIYSGFLWMALVIYIYIYVSPSPERASEGDSSSNSQIRRIRYSVELQDQMVYSSLSTHNATEVVNDEVDALYIDNLCIKCRSPDCHGWPGCCNLCSRDSLCVPKECKTKEPTEAT